MTSALTGRLPSAFIRTTDQSPVRGSHWSTCSPDPLAVAVQMSDAVGGTAGRTPGSTS